MADVAKSKSPLSFNVYTQLRLHSQWIFIRKKKQTNKFFSNFCDKKEQQCAGTHTQLHFRDNQRRAFGISEISLCVAASPSDRVKQLGTVRIFKVRVCDLHVGHHGNLSGKKEKKIKKKKK